MQTEIVAHRYDGAAAERSPSGSVARFPLQDRTPAQDRAPPWDRTPARSRAPLLRPLIASSTAELVPEAQFDAWRTQFGPVVEMLENLSDGPGYAASCTMWKLGPFALSTVVAPAARYRRTGAQIRRDSLDQWVISLTRRGSHSMVTGARLVTVPAGSPFIFSLADAFEGWRTEINWLCLFASRETFPELGPTIDRCSLHPLDSGMGLFLGTFLSALETALPAVTEAELPQLVAAIRAMLAACVAPSAETREGAAAQLELSRRERVRQLVRQNLRSPTLTPHRICRVLGMSRSQLYRLFEPRGGVARYIHMERLREAHFALSNPDNRRAVHAVAEDVGFFDASTFSRAFRQEFGCTPSDVRVAALSGGWSELYHHTGAHTGGVDFATVLRQL